MEYSDSPLRHSDLVMQHLGKVDGQQAGRVVDDQGYLGPAQTRPLGRCRRR